MNHPVMLSQKFMRCHQPVAAPRVRDFLPTAVERLDSPSELGLEIILYACQGEPHPKCLFTTPSLRSLEDTETTRKIWKFVFLLSVTSVVKIFLFIQAYSGGCESVLTGISAFVAERYR